MHIKNIPTDPLETIAYIMMPQNGNAAQNAALPIYQGTFMEASLGIDAIIVASDLQGVVQIDNEIILLGEILAENLKLILELYFPSVKPERTLILLCGDLYANLTKRGQSGNPISVWKKFALNFGWTVGIAGNHDDFGDSLNELYNIKNCKFLVNETVEIEGIRIAGLSGIIGRTDKNFRLSEKDYVKALSGLIRNKPDILLTHLSPEINEREFQGDQRLTKILEEGNKTLLFCGHSHWQSSQPYHLKNQTQIVNADSKAYILVNKN